MSDFAPPSGPPPPKVPAGYKAVWNDQYKEWFYVNIYTKKSTWDKPTEPVYPSDEAPPSGPPPTYAPGSSNSSYPTDTKSNPYDTQTSNSNTVESDAALAARLQAEEDARAASSSSTGNRDAMQDYQNTPMPPGSSGTSSYSQELPAREQKKGGFLGKLLGKASGSSSSQQPQYQQPQYQQQQQQYAPQQGYGGYAPQPQYQQYPPQQQGYGGYGGGYGGVMEGVSAAAGEEDGRWGVGDGGRSGVGAGWRVDWGDVVGGCHQ
ncbi:WW domain-containing protein wwm1 [Clarireedia jacksonii]